jgi:plastocyanin
MQKHRVVMRSRALGVILFAAVTLFCQPALGANQSVTTTPTDSFTPSQVTVSTGESVTWTNGGGDHNVHFDDNSFVMPPAPSTAPWTVSHQFTQAGTFRYYCEVHGAANGIGMSGSVVVTATGSPPAPPGPGTPSPAPGDAKPITSMTAPSTQRVGKLYVRASVNEPGTLRATGRVNVPSRPAKVYRFKTVTRSVAANTPVKLRLKLSRKASRTVKRALRRKRLRARITVTARDQTGNEAKRTRTIRLTR